LKTHYYKICQFNLQGNSTLEDKNDSMDRKLQFSLCRPSYQGYRVNLNAGIYDADSAFGHVVISRRTDDGLEEVTRLRVLLTPPQRPPSPPKTQEAVIGKFTKKTTGNGS